VNPIVAVFLGWTLLGEDISPSMLAAGAAIVVSVALIVGTSNRVTEPGRGLRRSPTEPVSEIRPPP
jgi:threonine/homoserine efflux transporter RhtA